MSTAPREFDIVIYGATGFVGRLTAEYLSRAAGGARVALAGRSPDRLERVRETLTGDARSWPILTADASAPSTLQEMAARTRVVVTTVGGLDYLVFRPLLNEFIVSMPRQAAIVYPKDAAQILMRADIFPGPMYWRPA